MKKLLLTVLLCSSLGGHSQTLPEENHSILYQEKSSFFYGSNGIRQIPVHPFGARLDYQSDLRIVVDANQLAEAIAAFKASNPAQNNLPALTPNQKAKLARITQIGNAARTAIQVQDEFVTAYEQIKRNPPADSHKSLRELNLKLARSKVEFLEPLIDYCEAKIRAEQPLSSDDEVVIEANALAEKFVRLYPRDGYLYYNLPALMEFAAAETKAIYDQVTKDAATVQATASISLRMRAFRQDDDGGLFRLHIENYDTLTNMNVQQEPRISYQPSERDQARLQSQKKAYEEGIQIIKDLKNKQSELRTALDNALTAFQGDLRAWKTAVTNLDTLQSSLTPIIAALDKAGASSRLTANVSNLITQVKTNLTEVAGELKNLRDTMDKFATTIRSGNPDSIAVLVGIMKTAGESVDKISQLSTKTDRNLSIILNNLKTIEAEVTAVVVQDPPNLQDLAEALKAGAPGSVEALGNLQRTALAQYPELVAAFRALWIKTDQAGAAENAIPIELDPNLLDVDTTNPPEGLISLKKNYPRGDATLDFTAALVSSNAATGQPISRQIETKSFTVEKFGLINTWSANLIFVKRLGDLDPTEEDSQFAPAPAVSWTLHYNQPPDEDGRYNSWERTWKTLDPGWGINVATLDWNDSIQVGLGTHITLFKDVITVGGGWNLNESKHGGYLFIGIGVFEAFGQLGLGKNSTIGR